MKSDTIASESQDILIYLSSHSDQKQHIFYHEVDIVLQLVFNVLIILQDERFLVELVEPSLVCEKIYM